MTRSQIIDTALRRTEKKAKALDANVEFATALQEIALEARFWWRRKIKSFTIQAGISTYPFVGDGSLGIGDFQQAPRDGLMILGPNGVIVQPEPIFDFKQQQMIKSFQSTQQASRPTSYFVIGAPGEMTLDPIPDRDYMASLSYWSVPIYTPGGAAGEDEAIPSLPAYFHPILIKKLEMHFNAYSLGEGSAKYQAAAAEYQMLMNNANLYDNFSEGEVRSFAADNQEDSVRSS
jgi:hypothetical protein